MSTITKSSSSYLPSGWVENHREICNSVRSIVIWFREFISYQGAPLRKSGLRYAIKKKASFLFFFLIWSQQNTEYNILPSGRLDKEESWCMSIFRRGTRSGVWTGGLYKTTESLFPFSLRLLMCCGATDLLTSMEICITKRTDMPLYSKGSPNTTGAGPCVVTSHRWCTEIHHPSP